MGHGNGKATANRARVLRPDGLRETEERFRTAFVQAPMPQALVDVSDGAYVAVNEEFCALVGYEAHELITMRARDLSVQEDLPRVAELVGRMTKGETDRFTVDKRYVRKDGQVRWVRAFVRLVRDDAGRPRYVHSLVVDRTGERSAEQALAASEARLRALAEHSEDLVLVVAAHGLVRHVGPNCGRVAPALALPGASLFDVVASGQAAELRDCLTEVALRGGTRRLRLRAEVDGQRRHWDVRLEAPDAHVLEGIVVTLRDVGAHARAEELAEGEAAILRMVVAGASRARQLDAVARLFESLYPEQRATILVRTEDGRRLVHGAAPSLPDEYVAAVDHLPIAPGSGVCGTAAYLNQPVIVEDLRREPTVRAWLPLLDRLGLRSCWSLPIAGPAGEVTGTFAMYGTEPSRPDAEQWRVAQRLAHLTGLVIAGHGVAPGRRGERLAESAVAARLAVLTPREREIFRLLALGHTNHEIAELVHVSIRTVESQRAAIMRKLEAGTRAELVRVALETGVLAA